MLDHHFCERYFSKSIKPNCLILRLSDFQAYLGHLTLQAYLGLTLIGKSWKTHPEPFPKILDRFLENSPINFLLVPI